MRKLTIFLLIIALTHSLTEGACTERTDTASIDQIKPNESDSVATSVSNFFTDVGCTLQSGAKTVKERVQSGYQFLKQKITNDNSETTNPIEINNKPNGQPDDYGHPRIPLAPEEYKFIEQLPNVPLAPEEDRIVFNGPIETSTQQIQPIVPTTPAAFSLDDRIALTAPTICRKGERLENDRCRKVSNF